jgi:sensor histidine kinase YesM
MPPLLLQPYVENAIWHGIMAKEGKGKISISLENRKGSIHCTVRDNGIGRAKALELKGDNPTGRKSHGMNITAERLALLNRDRPRAITVRISDLTDAQGFPCGTLVEMDIPKDF